MKTNSMPRLLVVDDEATLCEVLKINLELEGYLVDTAYSAEEVLTLDVSSYNLILLDVMMGDMSGFELAKKLKQSSDTADIPIIFCTAKDDEDDMIDGLNIGADDYIAKPYSVRNVSARIKSVLRRVNRSENDERHPNLLIEKGLKVDPETKRCIVDGTDVVLPRKEFEILYLLMSNPGKIFSRENILRTIWPDDVIVLERVVDVNITRLRAAIEPYGKLIVTRSGYGYGFKL